jgi:hypothetical protein
MTHLRRPVLWLADKQLLWQQVPGEQKKNGLLRIFKCVPLHFKRLLPRQLASGVSEN